MSFWSSSSYSPEDQIVAEGEAKTTERGACGHPKLKAQPSRQSIRTEYDLGPLVYNEVQITSFGDHKVKPGASSPE